MILHPVPPALRVISVVPDVYRCDVCQVTWNSLTLGRHCWFCHRRGEQGGYPLDLIVRAAGLP